MQFGQWAGKRAQVGAQADTATVWGRTRRCGPFIQHRNRTRKKGENMGMRIMLEQFPEHRRQDPKRGAEARVFDALQNLDLDGHGLYEYRYRREGKQVDYPLWLHSLARFAA